MKNKALFVGSLGMALTACGPSDEVCPDLTVPVRMEDKNFTLETPFSGLLPEDKLREGYKKVAETREALKVAENCYGTDIDRINMVLNAGQHYHLFEPKESKITFDTLKKIGIVLKDATPLVDLGAFPHEKLLDGTLDLSRLSNEGIRNIVIMEDRAPKFFTTYEKFVSTTEVPLNRHGKDQERWTMADLRQVVNLAHQNNLKVIIGFWANTTERGKNAFITGNWEALKPIIPGSDDFNPLSFVKNREGKEEPSADFVAEQFGRLQQDFDFDGLMAGDGMMGSRTFPEKSYYNFCGAPFTTLWVDFYRRIASDIKALNPNNTLWAYDVMGNGMQKACRNGVLISEIAQSLDHWVFQAYGSDAWGPNFMGLPGYDLARDKREIETLTDDIKAKTSYTVGVGDAVEGWVGTEESIKEKNDALAPHAKAGTVIVWATAPVRTLLEKP